MPQLKINILRGTTISSASIASPAASTSKSTSVAPAALYAAFPAALTSTSVSPACTATSITVALVSSGCVLLPLLQCIVDAGLALTDAQRAAAASLSEHIDEMNEDTFDVIPDDPDVDDPERELAAAGDNPVLLRQLAEKLVAQAARKREREEDSD